MCKIKDCSLDKYENFENCILHCKKDDWYLVNYNKQVLDIKLMSLKFTLSINTKPNQFIYSNSYKINKFWDEIKNKIDSITAGLNKDEKFISYRFEKVYFPPSIEKTNPFFELNRGLKEENKLNINFIECHFLGKTDFDCIVKAKDINFDNCYFYEDIEFKSNIFNHLFLFENCTVYKKIEFKNIIFNSTTSFIETSFYGDFDLVHSKFESLALFNDIKINKFKIDNTFFKDEANFLNIKNKDEKKLKSINIENRETARIIKHSFEKIDNIIEANKFYALEMQKREEELKDKNNNENSFFDLIVFKIHGVTSNYAQNYLLPIFWIITFGIASALINFYSIKEHLSIVSLFKLIYIFPLISWLYYMVEQNQFSTWKSFLFSIYLYYIFVTKDFFLSFMVTSINPFSKISADINISQLIIKIIMAYLIYQFIISIRQNTRRK